MRRLNVLSMVCIVAATFLALSLIPAGSSAQTQSGSIGPDGGDRFDLRIDPDNNQILYVYGLQGIHKWTNSDQEWTRIFATDCLVSSLVFTNDSPRAIFVGTEKHGIWKSINGGQEWVCCSNGLPAVSENEYVKIASLEIRSDGVLYAGITETDITPAPAWIYSSNNGGATWQPAADGLGFTVPQQPCQPVSVFLSKGEGNQLWAMVYGGGVFRLDQGGWASHNGNLPQEALRATFLAHDPMDADHLFLGTESSWVYESTNSGVSWTQIQPPQQLQNMLYLCGSSAFPLVYFIGVDPHNPGLITIRANDISNSPEQPFFQPLVQQACGAGLYTTFNGGANWVWDFTPIFRQTFDSSESTSDPIPGLGAITRSKFSYITSGGASCVEKSIDGQINDQLHLQFDPIINGIHSLLVNAVYALPNSPNDRTVIYAGAEAGIFRNEDGDSTEWEKQKAAASGLYTWSFAQDFNNPTQVFYSTGNPAWGENGSTNRGIYRTDVGSQPEQECGNWCCPGEQILLDKGVWRVVTSPAAPSKIYAACQEDGILVMCDDGETWTPLNTGLSPIEIYTDPPLSLTDVISITDLVLEANGEPLFAAQRTSCGKSWIWPDETEIVPRPVKNWVPRAEEKGGVYKFTAGQGWDKLEIPSGIDNLPDEIDPAVMALDYDSANDILYAATVRGIFVYEVDEENPPHPHIWKSFQPVDVNFDYVIFTDILIDPFVSRIVFAGSINGLYESTDRGGTWTHREDGLPIPEIIQITSDPYWRERLYVATAGGSVHWVPKYHGAKYVPSDYTAIKEAIAACGNGDIIIVHDSAENEPYTGPFNTNIDNFGGKSIALLSEHGPKKCVIDCQNTANCRGFKFNNGETQDTVVDGFTITNGSYATGAGIRIASPAEITSPTSPTISNCVITGNTATNNGGGIYILSSSSTQIASPTISTCVITDNGTTNNGGGIYAQSTSSTITNCVITDNTATLGGGIYCVNTPSPTIINCAISQNSTTGGSGAGGGIFSQVASPAISNCVVTGNEATYAGGIYCCGTPAPNISNCTVSDNSASVAGGGGEVYAGSPTITKCTFSRNYSGYVGGGLYYSYTPPSSLTNCDISGNVATYGGGLYYSYSNTAPATPSLLNSTIVGNLATGHGGGITCFSSQINEKNCIMWSNIAAYGPSMSIVGAQSSAAISYSDFEYGSSSIFKDPACTTCSYTYDSTNLSNVNPSFVQPGFWAGATWTEGDYHLDVFSSCIDMGTLVGAPDDDVDGDPRPVAVWQLLPDIGSDEYVDCESSGN